MYIGDSIARQISSCSLGMYNGTQMHNWCDLGFMYKDAADKKAANNGPWSLSEGEIEVRFRWDPYLGNLCGGNFEGIDQWATHVVVSSGLHQARDGNDKEKWGHCMETLGEWISKKGMKESFIYVTSPRVVEHKLPNVRYADYSNKKVTPFSEAATVSLRKWGLKVFDGNEFSWRIDDSRIPDGRHPDSDAFQLLGYNIAVEIGLVDYLKLIHPLKETPPQTWENDPRTFQKNIKLMPLGDSITASCCIHYDESAPDNRCCTSQSNRGSPTTCCKRSYRHYLYEDLMQTHFGPHIDFVGGESGLVSNIVNVAGAGFVAKNITAIRGFPFDQDHEGHWGWSLEQLRGIVKEQISRYQPDFVLLHAGTNNMWGESVEAACSELEGLVLDILDVSLMGATILLATIIPIRGKEKNVDEYNDCIRKFASSASPRVKLVEQHDNFSVDSMIADDGIHPNVQGEEQMADNWFDVLRPLLDEENMLENFVSVQFAGDNAIPTGELVDNFVTFEGSLNRYGDMFENMRHFFKQADAVVGNVECVIGNIEEEKVPPKGKIYCNEGMVEAMSVFEGVGISMNHALDGGIELFDHTVELYRKGGSNLFGISDVEDGDKNPPPLIIEKNGMRIGVFAYNWGSNCAQCMQNGKYMFFGHTTIESAVDSDLNNLKDKYDLDYLVVYVHVRDPMYTPHPEKTIVSGCRNIVELGADAVVASHTHSLQSFEIHKGAPIFYSLGNFLFKVPEGFKAYDKTEAQHKLNEKSVLVSLRFGKTNSHGVRPEVLPVTVDRNTGRVYPAASSFVSPYDYLQYLEVQEDQDG